MNTIIEILKYIWQLPQHIVALVYYVYLMANFQIIHKQKENKYTIYTKTTNGSVTLGRYIFASYKANEDTIKHEQGHTVQSLILGPLYLLVIGLPSIVWACIHRSVAPDKKYEWFYTERWADKLGGVE